MKNLRLHNVSIHKISYQNWVIIEYARKKKLKSWSHGIKKFFVRHRKTYEFFKIREKSPS